MKNIIGEHGIKGVFNESKPAEQSHCYVNQDGNTVSVYRYRKLAALITSAFSNASIWPSALLQNLPVTASFKSACLHYFYPAANTLAFKQSIPSLDQRGANGNGSHKLNLSWVCSATAIQCKTQTGLRSQPLSTPRMAASVVVPITCCELQRAVNTPFYPRKALAQIIGFENSISNQFLTDFDIPYSDPSETYCCSNNEVVNNPIVIPCRQIGAYA